MVGAIASSCVRWKEPGKELNHVLLSAAGTAGHTVDGNLIARGESGKSTNTVEKYDKPKNSRVKRRKPFHWRFLFRLVNYGATGSNHGSQSLQHRSQ